MLTGDRHKKTELNMNNLTTLLDELKKLDDQNPKEWNCFDGFSPPTDIEKDGLSWIRVESKEGIIGYMFCEDGEDCGRGCHAGLTINYRNQTPKLIAIIEKLLEQRDSLVWLKNPKIINKFNKEIEAILEN